ncbi:MAG TPA: DUF1080 domain-containing protein [Gemmatimonadales bacterium]|nr:DUF1080 domain-containing protein [Gemmatimonadales bacterium]
MRNYLLLLAAAGCSRPAPPPESSMAVSDQIDTRGEPSDTGWRPLLDESAAAWRGYRSDRLPAGWQVVDGALTRVAKAGDIVTREQFQDFELTLEWKVAPGGNSGVFYRVIEAPELKWPWQSGPEAQVLDDAGHRDGARPETSAGACYGLYPVPRGVARPAGEWNEMQIVVQGSHVEHWLNGRRVVAYELGSAEWEERVGRSKFADLPSYGRATRGHIALQDHGDWVAYRNIRIRDAAPRP